MRQAAWSRRLFGCQVETLAEDLTTKGRLYGVRAGLDARTRMALRREARKAAAS